jgi:hypothetical protein
MPVTATAVTQTPAKHPHIDGIGDFPTYQAIRLLNDRVQDLTNRLAAAEGTIASLLSTVNTLETAVAKAQKGADEALAISQEP